MAAAAIVVGAFGDCLDSLSPGDPDERAAAAVGKMTLDEKLQLVFGYFAKRLAGQEAASRSALRIRRLCARHPAARHPAAVSDRRRRRRRDPGRRRGEARAHRPSLRHRDRGDLESRDRFRGRANDRLRSARVRLQRDARGRASTSRAIRATAAISNMAARTRCLPGPSSVRRSPASSRTTSFRRPSIMRSTISKPAARDMTRKSILLQRACPTCSPFSSRSSAATRAPSCAHTTR